MFTLRSFTGQIVYFFFRLGTVNRSTSADTASGKKTYEYEKINKS